MSSFLDEEAEESENEEEYDEGVSPRPSMTSPAAKRKKKKSKAIAIDSEDEEEEDDDGVINDLIDDNPIEEDDSDNESTGSRKRKKSDDEDDDELDDRLEEEDYDLLEENLGVKVQRKKFKRLRRIEDDDSDAEGSQDPGGREAIANQLFEGSDDEQDRPGHVQTEEASQQYGSDESEGEYSETDDFIVDDEGRPLTEKRKKKKPIFTDAALQEAQEIFGVDFDYDEFEKYDDDYYDEEDEDDDEYEDDEQREIRRAKRMQRRRRKMKSIYEIYEPIELERAGITDYDNRIRNTDIPERMQLRSVPVTPATPEVIEEEAEWIFKMAFSKLIKKPSETKKNLPAETVPAVPPSVMPGDDNWDEENWDTNTVVQPPPASTMSKAPPKPINDDDWEEDDWEKSKDDTSKSVVGEPVRVPLPPATNIGDENWDEEWDNPNKDPTAQSIVTGVTHTEEKLAEEAKPKIVEKIAKALELMRNLYLEVPFIAFYRKEFIQPDLSINDLWKIYRLDARYCQLCTRKSKLLELFTNMKEYQTDWIMEHSEEPIPDSMRLITDEDLDRVKSIKSPEELKDMYGLFSLYYSEDSVKMKTALQKKRREEKARAKAARAAAAAAAAAEGGDANGEGEEDAEKEAAKEDAEVDSDLENDMENITLKRKIGGGTYSLCRKLGIDTLVKRFGLSPDKFAENLQNNYQRHEVEQYPDEPLEAAKEFVSPKAETPEDVLKAAKFMVSTQISREPLVRQGVREVFFERATISVYPTKKGRKEIDESHTLFAMKYLKDKPVRDLTDDQFLKLSIGEADKLITLRLGETIKGMMTGSYVDEVKQLYIKDEFTKHVQEWNELRGECVEYALEKILYPIFRKELRAKLLDECKEHVLTTCSYRLHNWIKIAPFKTSFPEEDDVEWDTSKGVTVLALAYVPDLSQASFACVVTPDGEASDYLRLQNIIKSKKAYKEADREEKLADLFALKNMIRIRKPHVIVIGGESREALMIQEDVRELVQDLIIEESFPDIGVEIVDNQLAKVFANSLKAESEFREFPLVLRQAVSLARRLQDPLIEFAQLCNPDDEILCLRYHTLQDHIPRDELLEYLLLEFVNRTNEVGVDVNRCLAHPYTACLLQFICGLGPRKANSLLKILKHNNQRLENRTQLITVCHMGPKIFINCSGFIKIDTNALGDSVEGYVEVLDGSRIHPETYEWARKMAVDALEYEDEDANPAGALEEILDAPERLKDLDLEAFARELERQGFGNKQITLYDIRSELNDRYNDVRTPYKSPNAEEMFNMLTKETPETLFIGKLVTATVVGISHKKPQGEQLDNAIPVRNEVTGMWQCAFCMKNDFPDLSEVWNHFDAGACPGQATGIRIRLDNGISGFIPISKLSDKQVTNPEERVKRGQTIHCRICKIDIERYSVECTSRSSDLADAKNEWRPSKDPYYDQETEDNEAKREYEAKKMRERHTYLKRVIVHPSFKNISFGEAQKLMETMDQGEAIIRPSSKGNDRLTVTWKVADGILQHIDVKEENKENAFSLGHSLWISAEEYEDLDEIIARHVNPMASHARDLLGFRYYVNLGGDRRKAEEYLNEERKKNANKIHYIVQASREYPGKFMLSYFPRKKVVHEFITVSPEGFRYRQQIFDTLNQLFKWFKDHYRDPPPAATPTPQAYPTRTPHGTPGFNDNVSRLGPAPSHMTVPGQNRNTPHFTTPGQAFTPYSSFNTHAPYTPTAQTPYMTPYQQGTTPRIPAAPASVSTFVHPAAVTPGHKTPQQRSQSRPHPDSSAHEAQVWRRAAEAWAKSSAHSWNRAKVPGAPASSMSMSMPPKSPARNAAQVISEGIQKTRRMNSSALNYIHKSPRSGRESLKSTPRTNFSPRSMVESSLGDETPLVDEH